MSDVYIIYSREDVGQADRLVRTLSTRWDVWWDDKIIGDFSTVIEREIQNTKCVVPLWSPTSKDKNHVKDELRLAEQYNIPIIPAKIISTHAPYGFNGYSAVDLVGWAGEDDHPGIQQLMRKISLVVPPRTAPKRPSAIAAGKVALPSLFLSVSSHETQLVPLEALKALRLFGTSTILVSAYDLFPPPSSPRYRAGTETDPRTGRFRPHRLRQLRSDATRRRRLEAPGLQIGIGRNFARLGVLLRRNGPAEE